MTETLAFWTTGENMTRIIRSLWEEGNCIHAMKTAEEGMNMPQDLAIKLFTGEMMLVGDTREGDHTLNLTEDDYKGKSIDRMFNFFKEKYIELQVGKLNYDSNLRRNMIKGLDKGSYQDILDVEREVNAQATNLEKEKFEYIKQIAFLCKISDHKMEELEEDLYSEVDIQDEEVDFGTPRPVVEEWVKNRIKAENEPLKMGKAGDSAHGWISPTGKFYVCGYMEHIVTADKLAEDGIVKTDGSEKELDELGWMKLTTNNFFMFGDKFTNQMRNFIMDHMIEMELETIELNGTTFKNIDDLNEYFDYRYGRI